MFSSELPLWVAGASVFWGLLGNSVGWEGAHLWGRRWDFHSPTPISHWLRAAPRRQKFPGISACHKHWEPESCWEGCSSWQMEVQLMFKEMVGAEGMWTEACQQCLTPVWLRSICTPQVNCTPSCLYFKSQFPKHAHTPGSCYR